ncbi:hypothetical protein QUF54_01725 [Candidatus Marithioploca araucensis]|uniref:Lipoprotein n=1 Tax=Candidatus Marithioploca araucensis TaxID=70273 RepID=A0ABT7VQW6_9GAMM|nr:hypothetical protein [Candidatus Marithioploca araucensis]
MQYLFKNCRWWFFVLLVIFGGVGCEQDIKINPDYNELVHKINPETLDLIYDKLEKLRKDIEKSLDKLSENNILRVEESAKRLEEKAKRDILEIEAQLNKDINVFVDRVEEKYRSAARQAFQQINKMRAEALVDLRYSVGFIDEKLEKRITQITLVLMEALTRLDETADKFRPEKLRSEIIEPTFAELDELTTDIVQHINQLVDKVGCKVGGTVINLEEALKRAARTMPQGMVTGISPNNQPCQSCKVSGSSSPNQSCEAGKLSPNQRECCCCREEDLLDKNNKPLMMTDIKLFRYNVCMLESELDVDSKVSSVTDAYATIQKWAMDVYCKSDLSRVTPESLPIQEIMIEAAARANERYLFWSKYKKRRTK